MALCVAQTLSACSAEEPVQQGVDDQDLLHGTAGVLASLETGGRRAYTPGPVAPLSLKNEGQNLEQPPRSSSLAARRLVPRLPRELAVHAVTPPAAATLSLNHLARCLGVRGRLGDDTRVRAARTRTHRRALPLFQHGTHEPTWRGGQEWEDEAKALLDALDRCREGK